MEITSGSSPRVAVFDQLPAVPTPYCTLSERGEMLAADKGMQLPTEDFDMASLNAITSQLQPWLKVRYPGFSVVWVEAEEPHVRRHCFQLRDAQGKRASPSWEDLDALKAFVDEIAAQRSRQVMLFQAATPVLDSAGRRVPPAYIRSLYPKLGFIAGSRFGDHILADVPPEGSSLSDQSWGGYAHTTVRTFRDEVAASYSGAIRALYEMSAVCADAATASAFGLLPAVTPDSGPGVRIGESLRSALVVPEHSANLYCSAEDETRRASLIPADELDTILTAGVLALPIRNTPFTVARIAAAIPGIIWIQDGMILAPCTSLTDYVGLKNVAHAASSDPEVGTTLFFLFSERRTALLADLLVRARLADAETSLCEVDDHRLPFALFARVALPVPAEQADALVADIETLRANAARSPEKIKTQP